MAFAKVTLYPFAYFNAKGEFKYIGGNTWPPYGDAKTNNGEVTEGNISVFLPSIEVQVPKPPMEELEKAAVALLRIRKDKLRADHYALMTRLQFAENSLLRLTMPEVLDAGEGPSNAKSITDDDDSDDIPF